MTCAYVEVAEFHKNEFVAYLQAEGFDFGNFDERDKLKLIMKCAQYFDDHCARQTLTGWLNERIQV